MINCHSASPTPLFPCILALRPASYNPLNLPPPLSSNPRPKPSFLVAAEASQRTITAQRQTSQVRQETRARLLRAVQQTYEDVFERAQIVPGHMYQLQKSANQALDHTDEPLCDWMYLQQNLQLPHWLRVLFRCASGHEAAAVNGEKYLYGSSVQTIARPCKRHALGLGSNMEVGWSVSCPLTPLQWNPHENCSD